jgi:hypothetical protein
MDQQPLRFIGEEIEVGFRQPPVYSKRPDCPDQFVWRGSAYAILELLAEWHDYRRRGRMGMNMRPERAATAAQRGSWGVGRYYFRVRTDAGRVFDIYYDRAPASREDRSGRWFLYRELEG